MNADKSAAEHPSAETMPVREFCSLHPTCKRDVWVECDSCRGDGQKYFDGDYPGDWMEGWSKCTACGGAGGWYDCAICVDMGDDDGF